MREKIYVDVNNIDNLKKYLSKSTYYRALKRGYFWLSYHKKEVVVAREYPDWLQDKGVILFARKIANKYGWKSHSIDIDDYVGEILLRWCELAGKKEMNCIKYRVVVAKNACKSFYHDWYCGGSRVSDDYYITLSEFIESSLNRNFWINMIMYLSENEKQKIEKFLNGKASLPLRIKRKIQKLIGGINVSSKT